MKRLDPEFVLQLMNWFTYAKVINSGPTILFHLSQVTGIQLPSTTILPEPDITDLRASLHAVARKFEHNGFSHSAELLRDIADDWRQELSSRLPEVATSIKIELKSMLLMQVPSDKARYYQQSDLFGQEVTSNFPTASYDIEEAGKTLATGRNTAVVFHLMRVLEVALKVVSARLDIPDPVKEADRNWGKMLDNIKRKIDENNKAGDAKWGSLKSFYENVFADLSAVKTAWCNPVMHVEGVYDEQRAEHIFTVVHGFMQHLATKLHEQN